MLALNVLLVSNSEFLSFYLRAYWHKICRKMQFIDKSTNFGSPLLR